MIRRQLLCTQPPLIASRRADPLSLPGRALVRICARIDQQPPFCLRHLIQHPDRPERLSRPVTHTGRALAVAALAPLPDYFRAGLSPHDAADRLIAGGPVLKTGDRGGPARRPFDRRSTDQLTGGYMTPQPETVSDLFPSRWLSPADLRGRSVTLTITAVTVEAAGSCLRNGRRRLR